MPRPTARARRPLAVEALEDRLVPATEFVTPADIGRALAADTVTGVTVISHGFQFGDDGGDSLMPLASAIYAR